MAEGGYTIAFGVEVENVKGGAGADMLTGNHLNNMLDGGAGLDTAVFGGDQKTYALTLSAQNKTIEDRSANGNGTDQLMNLEVLSFDTGVQGNMFDMARFAGTQALTSAQMQSSVELYIGYFDRAPDAVGPNS